ncbi:putative FES1-Hsp70 nucleotide exchange factor protein [Rutstroemia sp. NJR-2017a BVV2]|nr:putative FES1-Hsp70 nucleotide exchange factor protein [Rutstroemia sp. NJR-2017a BVV2]
MAMQPGLNELLKWSVENSSAAAADPAAPPPQARSLPPDAINALFGGPSDADLMKASMAAILSTDPEVTVDDKLIAFDNFEQLIENLDNANNLDPLGLWSSLLGCLEHREGEIRVMAAWCVGTAVQNNEKAQNKLVEMGGVEGLVKMACDEGEGKTARRKAVYALSSAVRNCQGGMDIAVKELGKLGKVKEGEKVDATDMERIDTIMEDLREEAAKADAKKEEAARTEESSKMEDAVEA